jgi:predicted acetyltransferase
MKKARKKYEALIEYAKDGVYELFFYEQGQYRKIVESESPSDLLHYLLEKHENNVIIRIPPVIKEIIDCEAFEYHKWVANVEKELLNGIQQAIDGLIGHEETDDQE